VSRVLRAQQIIGHFGDESFQTITFTVTDNKTKNKQEKYTKTPLKNTQKYTRSV